MRVLTDEYKKIFRMKSQVLLKEYLPLFLKKNGYLNQKKGTMYLYAKGSLPIMLVAHVDTVHKIGPADIFYDREQNVVWSPEGIGGDDRAGVIGIIELIKRGYRPHILFTDGEEVGGIGAEEASKALRKESKEVRFLIELDRKGSTDACFYDCNNKKFIKYIEGYGFKKKYGIFTDISILMPAWNIAGVNLSIGYYNAHSSSEFIKLDELFETVNKVEEIFKNVPEKRFQYKGLPKRCSYSKYGKSTSYYTSYSNYYSNYSNWSNKNSSYSSTSKKYNINHLSYTGPEDYKKNKSNNSHSYETIDSHNYGILSIEICASDLSQLYGGDTIKWANFLKKKEAKLKDEIYLLIEDYLLNDYEAVEIIFSD